MTLDRETARALFGEAPPVSASATTVAAEPSPFAEAGVYERLQGHKARPARRGVDWRLAAPVGVAVVCIGAIALFALPRSDDAVEGKTVAASEIAPPPAAPAAPLPVAPAPVETAAVTPAPAPVVQRAATPPRPAARRAPTRTTVAAAAPSATDSGSNVSATAPAAPPPPSLGAPTTVTLQPSTSPMPAPATPPVVEPQ